MRRSLLKPINIVRCTYAVVNYIYFQDNRLSMDRHPSYEYLFAIHQRENCRTSTPNGEQWHLYAISDVRNCNSRLVLCYLWISVGLQFPQQQNTSRTDPRKLFHAESFSVWQARYASVSQV